MSRSTPQTSKPRGSFTTVAAFLFGAPVGVGLLVFLWLERRESILRSRPHLAPVNWQAFLAGAAGAGFLMYPYFSYFLVLNIGNKAPLKLIPAGGGAFEVSINGDLIYSKLKTGKFPEEQAILDMVGARLKK